MLWKTLDPQHPVARDEVFLSWLRESGVDPRYTYRVRLRGKRIKVWQFDRRADGLKYVDPTTGRAAVREPFVVMASRPLRGVCRSGKRRYVLRDVPPGRACYPCLACRSWHLGLPWFWRLRQVFALVGRRAYVARRAR